MLGLALPGLGSATRFCRRAREHGDVVLGSRAARFGGCGALGPARTPLFPVFLSARARGTRLRPLLRGAICPRRGAAAAAAAAAFKIEFGRCHIGHRGHRDGRADQLFDRGDALAILGRGQSEGAALSAGAAGAADAVHVILGMVRHVEAEDVRHALDIEPARGDVAAHEQADLAVLEALQRLGPLRLRHVAVQSGGIEAMAGQRALQDVDIALAVAEDQRVLDVLAADQPAQRLALVFRRDDDERLLDGGGGGGGWRDGDRDGVGEEGIGEAADLQRHRRREEQRLARFRQQPNDAFDIGDEQDLAALEQVEQPARGGDQHVDAAIELFQLIGKAFAADQQRRRQPVVFAVDLEGCLDLRRQFARRFEDQRPRHARPGAAGGQLVDHRQGKAGGLAGAGLGTAKHVAALGDDGDRLLLDRGGGGVAGVRYRLKKFRRESKFIKIH